MRWFDFIKTDAATSGYRLTETKTMFITACIERASTLKDYISWEPIQFWLLG